MLSEKEIREIMAGRARGESFTSIGERLGYPHSTIIRGHKNGLAAQAAEMAEAAAESPFRCAIPRPCRSHTVSTSATATTGIAEWRWELRSGGEKRLAAAGVGGCVDAAEVRE